MRIALPPLDKWALFVDAVPAMTKPASNLAAALLVAREESSKASIPMVEATDEASEFEDDGAWIDEVTNQVAARWSGQREGVPFEAAMASAERRARRR